MGGWGWAVGSAHILIVGEEDDDVGLVGAALLADPRWRRRDDLGGGRHGNRRERDSKSGCTRSHAKSDRNEFLSPQVQGSEVADPPECCTGGWIPALASLRPPCRHSTRWCRRLRGCERGRATSHVENQFEKCSTLNFRALFIISEQRLPSQYYPRYEFSLNGARWCISTSPGAT